jgi:hypothetical protein
MWLHQAIIGCERFTYWLFKTRRHVPRVTSRFDYLTTQLHIPEPWNQPYRCGKLKSHYLYIVVTNFQFKSSKLLTYFIIPCMTFRFLYSFKLPKRLTNQKRGWRWARINDEPRDEADRLPHPSPEINNESSHTLTRPAPYACTQHIVATLFLLLHAYTVNQNQWNHSYILELWMTIR